MSKRKYGADNSYHINKKQKLNPTSSDPLDPKIECLELISIAVEYKYNLNLSNFYKIKEYLLSNILTKRDKKEVLNDYYFHFPTSQSYNIQSQYTQNQYASLTMICKVYCSMPQQPMVPLWLQLTHFFITNGMNPFINNYTSFYLPPDVPNQYIHKKTLRNRKNRKNHKYWNLKIQKEPKHYELLIHAVNTYSHKLPPIFYIKIQTINKRFRWWAEPEPMLCTKAFVISQFISDIDTFNFSPQSLQYAIHHLSCSLLINTVNIDRLDQFIYNQFIVCSTNVKRRIYGLHSKDEDSALILSYFFVIKCFYQQYQQRLLLQLKNNRNFLPFDIVKLIMNEYYFQNLEFVDRTININELFYVFFLNIHRLSPKWQQWICDDYLKELNEMIHESAIDLLTDNIAVNMLSEIHFCKIDDMSMYILSLFKYCKLFKYRYIRISDTKKLHQSFESLFIKASKTLNYWPMIMLMRNNLINISNCKIDYQLMEHEMHLEELEEMGSFYEMERCCLQDGNVLGGRDEERKLFCSLLRNYIRY